MVAGALERGIEVIGELELAWRALPNRFVAVTGTNGKTTTVELAGEMFRAAGHARGRGRERGHAAGLAGRASWTAEAWVVCECSSFQLEDSSAFAPEVAVLLNLEEDHLDRHGTLERYREAKLRVFANQPPDAVAIAPEGFELPGDARRCGLRRPERDGDPAARCAQRRERRRRGRRRAGGGRATRGAWPRRCAPSPAWTTAWRRWPTWEACCT